MTRIILFFLIVLLLLGLEDNVLAMSSQPDEVDVTFELTEIPEYTPEKDDIYMVGNMSNWMPGKEEYKLKKNEAGNYEITLTVSEGEKLAYKFTRGLGWYYEERDSAGNATDNRIHRVKKQNEVVEEKIHHWSDMMVDYIPEDKNTLTGNVEFIQGFEIPQLNRERNIWVYLPTDYDEKSDKEYPVVYMHDGQNIFNEVTSNSGEWKVDENLERLFDEGETDGVIVVAIDNNPDKRFQEYIPWSVPYDPEETEWMDKSEADEYMKFIVETLKPHIDREYRTLEDRENTGIMGSSLGGVISLYGGFKYQNVFSKIGALSPSFLVFEYNEEYFKKLSKERDMQIYIDYGTKESSNESYNKHNIELAKLVNQELLAAGFKESSIKMVVDEGGEHSEKYWSQRFPGAFLWLYEN
ncbi:MAG: alpha/beta hydrolase [Bacillota bacterium]